MSIKINNETFPQKYSFEGQQSMQVFQAEEPQKKLVKRKKFIYVVNNSKSYAAKNYKSY